MFDVALLEDTSWIRNFQLLYSYGSWAKWGKHTELYNFNVQSSSTNSHLVTLYLGRQSWLDNPQLWPRRMLSPRTPAGIGIVLLQIQSYKICMASVNQYRSHDRTHRPLAHRSLGGLEVLSQDKSSHIEAQKQVLESSANLAVEKV